MVRLALAFILLLAGVLTVQRLAFSAPAHAALLPLARWVDPFLGTAGDGNVFPGADVPFGMLQWSPESTAGGISKPGGYNDGDLIIRGFGLTHLSGAGCVAYENVPIMPTVRPIVAPPQPNGSPYSDRFIPGSQHASPGFYGVRLASGITTQLTVTTRTGLGAFTFPAERRASILLDAGNGAGATSNMDGDVSSVRIAGRTEVTGWARGGNFCGLGNHYTLYFAVRFNRPFVSSGIWQGDALHTGTRSASGFRSGAYVSFDTRKQRTVLAQVGVSYVSTAGALANLHAEQHGWSLSRVRQAASAQWNGMLNRVQVSGGTPSERTTFYTALYHSLLAPTVFGDADGRYRGFDGHVHRAQGYTPYANFSGWDIYRSEIPLLAWLAPRQTSDMMQSLVQDAREGGRLPRWPVANDYTGEMDGDSADPIIAGAAAFGANHFDRSAALGVMVAGAMNGTPARDGYVERPDLADYLRLGWAIPQTGGWGAAAQTLEYATDDYAIGRLAQSLGNRVLARTFLARGQTWRTLWNARTGFLQAREHDGTFLQPFDPTAMTGYVEGDAYQYLWAVPQNIPALIRLVGGRKAFIHRLDAHLAHWADGPQSPYYWGGNEPEMEVPWEYDWAGAPRRTDEAVRRIMTHLYGPGRHGLPGNDDLGALSSWYVWAALGLYPEIPGVGGLALAAPLFPQAVIHLAGGDLRIDAPGAASNHPDVRARTLNGRLYRSNWLPLSAIGHGGTLRVDLGGERR